jgi:hypothetical protein
MNMRAEGLAAPLSIALANETLSFKKNVHKPKSVTLTNPTPKGVPSIVVGLKNVAIYVGEEQMEELKRRSDWKWKENIEGSKFVIENSSNNVAIPPILQQSAESIEFRSANLEELPAEILQCSKLKKIEASKCPRLLHPPIETVNRGVEDTKKYLKALNEGRVQQSRFKLIVLGHGRIGEIEHVASVA